MMRPPDETILKKDFMAKRSQMRRKLFLSPNFHSRWFILTTTSIKYFDGTIETGPKSLKGEICLSNVIAVETADGQYLGNRPFAFQVVYKYVEMNVDDKCTLYIISVHEEQKLHWIKAIHGACEVLSCNFSKMFHQGVWLGKCYSCCSSINKRSEGCQETSVLVKKSIEPLPKPQNEGNPVSESKIKKNNKKTTSTKLNSSLYTSKGIASFTGSLIDLREKKVEMESNNKPKTEDRITNISTIESLHNCKWYYLNLSKNKAIEMLMNDGREGCFIVRDSTKNAIFSLAILVKNGLDKVVKHYHINLDVNKGYFLSPHHVFETIPKLIDYHRKNSAGLFSRLKCYPFDDAEIYSCISSVEIKEEDLEIREKIGGGQFGEVYKALYKHNCMVAVKVMKQNGADEKPTSLEFIEEAKSLMLLDHPNLVKMLGVCRSKPIKIVTEYLKYGSLVQFLKRNKNLISNDFSLMISMCLQLCSGMKFLEENHIIHRDLAARNCLVGDKQTIKICDFGLARQVEDIYESSAGALFAIRWTSPEGLEKKWFSNKSDVWSFGVLMWEIFTCGSTPYEDIEKNYDVVFGVCAGTLRLQKPDNCSDELYEVLMQCWQEEKEDRPTFKELFTLLKKLEM